MIKNNMSIALLLITTAANTFSMKPSHNKDTGWIKYAGKALTDGAVALTAFFSYISSQDTQEYEPFPFTDLPKDLQNTILSLVIANNNAKTVDLAGQTINALAQTNHELNHLINDPQFCLHIIWHLAKQFNCSDQIAAEALQTREAKRRLDVQTAFLALFTPNNTFKKTKFNKLYTHYKDYIDLDFSYGAQNDDSKVTLLMIAAHAKNSAEEIECLLKTHAVDVNKANTDGLTALMFSALRSAEPKAVTLLCQYPQININQQSNKGNTALMLLCKNYDSPEFKRANFEVLLNMGADPEITDYNKLSPIQALQNSESDSRDAIALLKNAIEKKKSN